MSEQVLNLSIVSPEKKVFEGEAESITLPGVAGSFTILVHHAPVAATLTNGTISYTVAGQKNTVNIQGGFVEMSEGAVSVCIY